MHQINKKLIIYNENLILTTVQPGKSHQEGQVYTYELEGKAVTSVSEAQGEATMKLTATVELAAKPNCVRQVRLKNVQINGAVSIKKQNYCIYNF